MSSLSQHSHNLHSQSRARLLLVDDDSSQLNFYMASLSRDYDCEFAKSAKEAMQVSRSYPLPDLIVLDVEMPNVNGFELCRSLKNDDITKEIPVMFVSAASDINAKTKGFQVGCVDYVTKPVLIPELQARIDTHVKLRRQTQQLEALSYTDALTGVANRRRYNETLLREWQRCCRYTQALTLMIIDVDDFKAFNDFYGHTMGDQCLVKIARQMNGLVKRPGDLFSRIGGEEFALLLTDCDRFGASLKAEELLKSVANLNIEHQAAPRNDRLTISAGVAICTPSPGDEPLYLFQAADEALFRSKHHGKNKWTLSQSMAGSNVTQLRKKD